jgi:hypothetical protein
MQTLLPVAMALTYPGSRIAVSGIQGALLDEANRWDVALPLVTMFATGLINWAYCLPVTNSITDKRRAQGTSSLPSPKSVTTLSRRPTEGRATQSILIVRAETKDGKKSWDPAPHSQEMQSLNKEFGKIHGISSLLNLITLIATIAYGFNLSTRIR